MQRFKLSDKFKDRLKKFLAKGTDMHLAVKSAMTTKAINPKKPVSKMKKAKMSKSTKGIKKLKSKAKASKSKSKAGKK